MKKKGELSINMIIVIALGILVLIILAIVFADKIRNQENSSNCIEKGGVCRSNECSSPGQLIAEGKCPDEEKGYVCCRIV